MRGFASNIGYKLVTACRGFPHFRGFRCPFPRRMRRRATRDGFAGRLLQIGYSSPPVDFSDGLSAGDGLLVRIATRGGMGRRVTRDGSRRPARRRDGGEDRAIEPHKSPNITILENKITTPGAF